MWGRIGYERESSASVYNEETEDFEILPGTEGHASFTHYAINLENGRIAAEETYRTLTVASIRARFRGILNETFSEVLGLTVDFLVDEQDFERWLEEVDSVARVTVSFHLPNPHFPQGSETAKDFLEHWKAKSVLVTAVAPAGESLQVSDTELEDLSIYAHRYGRVKAQGQLRRRATRLQLRH